MEPGKTVATLGADSLVSAMFYRAVIHEVLLFGSDYWALSDVTIRVVEGIHVEFLKNSTGKRSLHQGDGTWETTVLEEVLQETGIQSASNYICPWQVMVAQWMELRPIVEVCASETGYEGGGWKQRL